jgi:hypothetical protein
MMIANIVGLLVFWFSVPLPQENDCESCWFAGFLVLLASDINQDFLDLIER